MQNLGPGGEGQNENFQNLEGQNGNGMRVSKKFILTSQKSRGGNQS